MHLALLLLSLSVSSLGDEVSISKTFNAVPPLAVYDSGQSSGAAARPATRTIAEFELRGLRQAVPTEMSSVGASPLVIRRSDGKCMRVELIRSGTSASAKVDPIECSRLSVWKTQQQLVPPRSGLRLLNASAGLAAWRDDRSGESIISDMWSQNRIRFKTSAKILRISAIRSPDTPEADLAILIDANTKHFVTFSHVSL